MRTRLTNAKSLFGFRARIIVPSPATFLHFSNTVRYLLQAIFACNTMTAAVFEPASQCDRHFRATTIYITLVIFRLGRPQNRTV